MTRDVRVAYPTASTLVPDSPPWRRTMRRLDRLTLPLVAIALGFVTAGARKAGADDATAPATPPTPPPTTLTADLGYVNTSGNSRVQTLTAGDKIEHHRGSWLFSQ